MLVFTIDNTGNPIDPVDNLAFTDSLPPGMTLAAPAFVSNSCGGVVDAPNGGNTITFSNGGIGAGNTCEIVVNVTAPAEGTYSNLSGDLTSDAGNSGSANADLTVTNSRPGFIKSFAPSMVEFQERSTLTFTIDNSATGSAAITSLNFTDILPSGMVVADPANPSTDCQAPAPFTTITAVPGSSVIAFDATGFPALAAGAICTVQVDIVGGAIGALGNVSGELEANFIGSGKAAAILEVTPFDELLTLTKKFSDDPAPPGGTVTLEFTITNRDRRDPATGIGFSDDLATVLAGLVAIGLPQNDICGAGSQISGTSTLIFTGGNLPPEGSCTFSVTLQVPIGTVPGAYPNATSAVTGTIDGEVETGNIANDLLFVSPFPVLTKEFTDDPVAAGGTTTIEFTITNSSPTLGMTDIAFIDELTDNSGDLGDGSTGNGFLPFPVSVSLPPIPNPPCGAGSSLSLISVGIDRQGLSLTGGNLASGASCTFSVTLDIPVGFPGGIYTNTTERPSGVVGGETFTGPPASDDIVVVGAPRLDKEFTDDPVIPGSTVTLEFTLSHDESAAGTATDISFTDDLAAALAGLTASLPPNPDPPCGVGSSLTGSAGDTLLTFAGGTLMPGESCTFSVTLQVPAGAGSSGTHTNTTSNIMATVNGVTTTNNPATDDLIVSGLLLTKEFTNDPVIPGDQVTLEFNLDNTSGTSDATSIFFSDDLAQILPGPEVTIITTIPFPACNGTLSRTGLSLTLSGASVTAGTSCSFDVVLGIPVGIANNNYNNTTSSLIAFIDGSLASLPSANDSLQVNADLLGLTKSFADDPVTPGDSATLVFTMTNFSATETVTDIDFSDDLDAALSGLEATSALVNECGGMATSGFPTGNFEYADGTLAAGESCTIVLNVDVPDAPLSGTPPFINTTSGLTGKVGALDVFGDPASDELQIQNLTFGKSFDGPSAPSGTATLEFTITNLGADPLSGLAFSDDLDAVITGLTATGLPQNNICGTGSMLSGTTFLAFTGGSLAAAGNAGDSCTFSVTVNVPAAASDGIFVNTTSELLSQGLSVADPATAQLLIEPPPVFNKAFAPDTIFPTQISTLTFTIDNSASGLAAAGLDFTDNLPADLTVASPSNASTTCTGGTLTAASGTGVVSYTGGSVAAGAICTITVDITGATPGVFSNNTGDLTSSSGNSGMASDDLTIQAASVPGFSKIFVPDIILPNDVSSLIFTIDNSASVVAATGLDFTDNLPAGLTVANPSNASTTCTGGTLTAASGTDVVSYTGGSVEAGSTCTVTADITGTTVGVSFNNISGNLTSSLGNSGTADDVLTIDTDSDGDGIFDTVDPDDDNDGLEDEDDPNPNDPDSDGDQIIDGLDPDPESFNNVCVGFGMPTEVTLENLLIPAGQTIVCAIPNSIMVELTVEFESPSSKLVLISLKVILKNGFQVPFGNQLQIISADPTALIVPVGP